VCAEQRTVQEGSSPSGAQMRGAVSEGGGNASPAGASGRYGEPYTGTQAKAGDSQGGPEATVRQGSGGQGVHREVESEGHEEQSRAVIEGATPTMNRSAKGGARSSRHYGDEGVLIHPPHHGVCGRHGTEEQGVTSGELAGPPGGTGGSDPISESEVGSGARSVVGQPQST
jgi:hypothetical protein